MNESRLWFRLQSVLCGLLFFLIVFGAGVRLADAGLACPDWPRCFGEYIPSFNFPVFMEWFHRLVAGLIGLMAVAIAVRVYTRPILRQLLGFPVCLSLVLFGIQAFLGRQTVIELLRAEIVASHLAFGYLLFAVNMAILLRWKRKIGAHETNLPMPTGLKLYSRWMLLLVYGQAIFGAVVSSHYAGMACPDFPTCHDRWWPIPFEGNMAIHMLHRLGALVVLLSSLGYLFYTTRLYQGASQYKGMHKLAKGGFIVVVCQWILGISMIFLVVHPALSLLHSFFALSIFSMYLIGALKVSASK